MALSNKRIIDLPERSALNSDDYTVVDGSNGGTGKYKLSQLQDDVGEVEQDVAQLSQTVTAQGTQVAQNTDEIADLKEDLNDLNDLSYGLPNDSMPITWFERGSITNGNNDSYRSGSRCRTKNILKFDYAFAVTVTQGDYIIFYYADDGTWISPHSGWKTSTDTIFIPANKPFRIMATLNKSASASQTDSLADMVDAVTFKADNRQTHIINMMEVGFEHGSLNNGADDTYNQAGRARSRICRFQHSIMASMKMYSFGVAFFNDKKEFTYTTPWIKDNKYLIPANTYFRITLSKDPTSGAYVDLDEMVNDLVLEPVRSTNVLNPNIIYQSRNVDDKRIPPESKWYVKQASKNQYDRVRFTVRKTTDGYYFNCHDDYINNVARNTDGTTIATQISANNQTLNTLNSYDWGIKYGSVYAGANVPLLEDGLKYASMYNLGVTFHSATSLVETDADIANICTMFDKYGLTDNMIVVSASGHNFDVMQKFKEHNPRISYYVGGLPEFFSDSANVESIKALQTGFNKIYVQLFPWGTAPSAEFIELAKENNFMLYDSVTMSESGLLTEASFQKGYTLREINNVYMVKDTIAYWTDNLIDA